LKLEILRAAKTLLKMPMSSLVAIVGLIGSMIFFVGDALADTPVVLPYGEVERFGGFDTGATYLTTGTSKTEDLAKEGEQAKFVYPIAMAVDTEDPSAPDKYAIYVLENTNPQALDAAAAQSNHSTNVSLEYRIQKVSDAGVLLAATEFTLQSTTSEPGLHAVSLAVDGPADRVYALIMDVPPIAENEDDYSAVDAIDAWTTGRHGPALAPAVGLTTGIDDDLPEDLNTKAGELAGSSTLQGTGSEGFLSDVDGASIAVYGSGETADLALAGNEYTSASKTKPIVELIATSGVKKGSIEASPWTDTTDTEDAAAKAVKQGSRALYSMSANPNGSLNVSLGPAAGPASSADYEPNMATIGTGALSPTEPVLPGAIVAENAVKPKPKTAPQVNGDAAAAMGFTQDVDRDSEEAFQPTGATRSAGTLAPSVVQLGGGGGFPNGLYAGLVAAPESEEADGQNSIPDTPPSWREAKGEEANGKRSITSPANLALRVFDPVSESLAMIGNTTPGGPCNLQSSPTIDGFSYALQGRPSFVALAPGREGVLFALVQSDLINATVSPTELISPNSSVGASMGDQVVEFAPGAHNPGAGANASQWRECPQPMGSFSVTDITGNPVNEPATGELAVPVGTKLEFDAKEVNLRGASPWAYDWDLEGGVNKSGDGPLFEYPWTVQNTFTATPEEGHAWMWPLPTAEAEFEKAGTYTETLKLVNDFGTLTAERKLRVIAPGAITGVKIAPSAKSTEGEPVVLNASATLPEGDKVKDYHWEFGDEESEDTGEIAEVEHTYAKAGVYTVTLTVTDVLGQEVKAKETVTIEPAQMTGGGKSTGSGSGTTTNTTTNTTTTNTTTTTTPVVTTPTTSVSKPKALTTAKKLADALKACKKDKSKKQRATCEKLAKKKYATKSKSKPKKSATKKK
jgi:PKD repeat protein